MTTVVQNGDVTRLAWKDDKWEDVERLMWPEFYYENLDKENSMHLLTMVKTGTVNSKYRFQVGLDKKVQTWSYWW